MDRWHSLLLIQLNLHSGCHITSHIMPYQVSQFSKMQNHSLSSPMGNTLNLPLLRRLAALDVILQLYLKAISQSDYHFFTSTQTIVTPFYELIKGYSVKMFHFSHITWWGLIALETCGAKNTSGSLDGCPTFIRTFPWLSGTFLESSTCIPLFSGSSSFSSPVNYKDMIM